MITVASFWVHRPEEHPNAADYPAMLRILQRSCDRLNLPHIVLTDAATVATSGRWPEGLTAFCGANVPENLMRACTELQAQYLESNLDRDRSILLVGADCIMLRWPKYPEGTELAVTYRKRDAKYPINTGAIYVDKSARERAAVLFRQVADDCGPVWCDDQRAITKALGPMPFMHGNYVRAGMRVEFLPMRKHNTLPSSAKAPASHAYMVHFRGKARKQLFFDWARENGFA